MQVIIKTLDGQKKPFNLEPEDTVLKVRVRARSGVARGRGEWAGRRFRAAA
jgi:hypothetical protein